MPHDRQAAYSFGFVMENILGHRTHYGNLRRFVAEDSTVAPTWMPIEFDTPGRMSRLPVVRGNWSIRASLAADREVRAARRTAALDLLFYHTQVTSLLSPLQADMPMVVSLDATPINYDSIGAHYRHVAGGRLEFLKHALNRRSFASATALVTWCQWAKDSLVHDYGVAADKVSVIAPGVDLAQWPRRSGRDRAQASEGRRLRLLFVGGDFERKGGEVLLECFRRNLRDDCELFIVTQSDITSTDPNVHVCRDVTPNSPTLLRLYAEADVFVFPTLADCAPLAVPEAMAASLPVISTRVGAIPEMVRDGDQGFLVTPGDVDELRVAIHRLLNSPHLRARLGDSGRAAVEADYDAARNAWRLLDVLKAAAGRPASATGERSIQMVAASN